MNRGGTESRLLDVLRCLDRSQFDPFLYVGKNRGDLLAEIHDQRVFVGPSDNLLRNLPGLWAILRREKPAVVWCLQSSFLSFAGRLVARMLRTPAIVLSVHGRYEGRAVMDRPNRLLTRALGSRVVVLSTIYRDWLANEGVPAHLIVVQHNGVDTQRFSPPTDPIAQKQATLKVDPARPVIGTVGSLLPIKTHEVLLRTASRIVAKHPDALFVFVGDGERRPALEQLAQTLGLSRNVRFLGKRNDVPDLLRAFDLFALSSYSEGCPNVVLEAMATGLPVVTTDYGGAAELVSDEVGIVTPAHDDAALAEAIIQLLGDPARRQAMAQAARRRAVEHFSLERMIQARERLLLELLEQRHV